MARTSLHPPHRPSNDLPEEFEPGSAPIEPDDGPVPAHIPDDPEHERAIDPAADPARPSRSRRSNAGQGGTLPRRAKAPLSAPGLALPHERDESNPATAVAPDPLMAQAKRDIDAGLVDTDMRATPGLDAPLRSRLVPGPGGKPPPSGG